MTGDTTYHYILNHYKSMNINPEEKLANRFLFLYSAAQNYIECLMCEEHLYVSQRLTEIIVTDYFADIVRLKQFHNLQLTNDLKTAAYTGYWIARRKPIVFKKDPDDETLRQKPFIMDINEWFAIDVMISIVYDRTKPIQFEPGVRDKYISLLDTLQYNLSYRVVTPQSLELSLVALDASPHYERSSDNCLTD